MGTFAVGRVRDARGVILNRYVMCLRMPIKFGTPKTNIVEADMSSAYVGLAVDRVVANAPMPNILTVGRLWLDGAEPIPFICKSAPEQIDAYCLREGEESCIYHPQPLRRRASVELRYTGLVPRGFNVGDDYLFVVTLTGTEFEPPPMTRPQRQQR